MWLWLSLALAAEPLQVQLVPDTAPSRDRRELVRAKPVAIAPYAAVVDGEREDIWELSPEGPRLLAFADGRTPPEADIRWLGDASGLTLGITGLPGEPRLDVLVEPLGAARAWWIVTVEGEDVSLLRCALPSPELVGDFVVPTPAASCVPAPTEGVQFAGADWLELHLPWSVLETDAGTSLMRVLVSLTGRGLRGGTWATGGDRRLLPHLAPPTAFNRLRGGFSVTETERGWCVTARKPGTWRYRHWVQGRLDQQGEASLSRDGCGLLTQPGTLLLSAAPHRGIAPATLLSIGRGTPAWSLLTPVASDRVSLGWSGRHHEQPVIVRVLDREVLLGESTVSVPQGGGILHLTLPASWPSTLTLELSTGQSFIVQRMP